MCRDEKITDDFDCEYDDEDVAAEEDDGEDDGHADVENDAAPLNAHRRKLNVLVHRLNLDDELMWKDLRRRRDRQYQRSIEDTFPYRSDVDERGDVPDEDDDDCKVSTCRSTSDEDNHRLPTRTTTP